MVELSRYNISDKQAGLDQGVLKNKLGYTSQKYLVACVAGALKNNDPMRKIIVAGLQQRNS